MEIFSSLPLLLRVHRGVASSPTPTKPRLSMFAGSLAGVTGSVIGLLSGVALKDGAVGKGGG